MYVQTITLRSRVDADGVLRLEIPFPKDHGDAEVRVTILPLHLPQKKPEELGYPPRFFEEVAGGWAGEPLVREPPEMTIGGGLS
jgi:hypothetical protein